MIEVTLQNVVMVLGVLSVLAYGGYLIVNKVRGKRLAEMMDDPETLAFAAEVAAETKEGVEEVIAAKGDAKATVSEVQEAIGEQKAVTTPKV